MKIRKSLQKELERAGISSPEPMFVLMLTELRGIHNQLWWLLGVITMNTGLLIAIATKVFSL